MNPYTPQVKLYADIENLYKQFSKDLLKMKKDLLGRPLTLKEIEGRLDKLNEEVERLEIQLQISEEEVRKYEREKQHNTEDTQGSI